MTDTYVPRQDEIVYNGSIHGIFYMYQLFMTSDQIRILYSWTQKKNGWSKSQIFCCHCPDIKRRLVLLWQVNEVTGVCDSFTFPFPNDSLRIKRKQIHIP